MNDAREEMQRLGHLSDTDAMMLRIERDDPQLRNTITAVLVLDDLPDRAALRDRVERMSRSVPGCRHRLVSTPLRLASPRWVVDRDFDVSYHLRWIAAPQPKTLDTVLEYARQSAMSGLDRDRPPAALLVGLAELAALHLERPHPSVAPAKDLDGRTEQPKLDALLFRMVHLFDARRHLGPGAAVNQVDRLRAEA